MATKEPARDPDREPKPGTPADDADDVEGHSLLQAELHREIATSRSREAADWARGEKARRENRSRDKGRSGR